MTVLLCEDHAAVRVLTLNRPEKHNALNAVLRQALIDALRAADADDAIRVVVLTGAGKSFCSGGDMSEWPKAPEASEDVMRYASTMLAFHSVCLQMSKPVVSAVRGNALGMGAGLAIDCDLVVMAEDARLGYPELKHGNVGALLMANLVRHVGRKKAFELIATAESIDGRQAEALGLANRVVPSEQVLETALSLADTLAGWKPLVMATAKRVFYRACDLPLAQALDAGRDMTMFMRGFTAAEAAKEQK